MKLNYRDKVILGILLAIVVLLGGFFGLIKPKTNEIKEDQATLAAKEEEKADLEARIARIEPLKDDINNTYDETSKLTSDFVPLDNIATPTDVDDFMRQYAEECGIRIMELNVTNVGTKTLGYYYQSYSDLLTSLRDQADLNGDYAEAAAKASAESSALSSRTQETVMGTDYAIRAVGTKENLWAYLKKFEDLGNTILINQVTINDYTFGADAEEAANEAAAPVESEEAEQPAENAEAGAEEGTETVPEPQPAPNTNFEELSEATNISEFQIVISIYSVYDMAKPNVEAE